MTVHQSSLNCAQRNINSKFKSKQETLMKHVKTIWKVCLFRHDLSAINIAISGCALECTYGRGRGVIVWLWFVCRRCRAYHAIPSRTSPQKYRIVYFKNYCQIKWFKEKLKYIHWKFMQFAFCHDIYEKKKVNTHIIYTLYVLHTYNINSTESTYSIVIVHIS